MIEIQNDKWMNFNNIKWKFFVRINKKKNRKKIIKVGENITNTITF